MVLIVLSNASTSSLELNTNLEQQLTTAVLYDFWGTVKAAPHECAFRTGQP